MPRGMTANDYAVRDQRMRGFARLGNKMMKLENQRIIPLNDDDRAFLRQWAVIEEDSDLVRGEVD